MNTRLQRSTGYFWFITVEKLKHRDSFGKEKKKFYILVIQYSKYFWTTFKLWTEVRLTIWWLNHAKYTYRFNVIDICIDLFGGPPNNSKNNSNKL